MPLDQSAFDPTGVDRNKPTVAGNAGLGTGAPAPTIDAQADDKQGTISFGSGTTPPGGVILTVTFARAKDSSRLPKILLQEANTATAGVDIATGTITSTSFTIATNTRNVAASQPAGTYAVSYLVMD